jgi:hypothetical protein
MKYNVMENSQSSDCVGWKSNKAFHSSSLIIGGTFTLSPNVDECSTAWGVGTLKHPESSKGGTAVSVSSAHVLYIVQWQL